MSRVGIPVGDLRGLAAGGAGPVVAPVFVAGPAHQVGVDTRTPAPSNERSLNATTSRNRLSSRGRCDQSGISSTTLSVIRETVSRLTDAP